MHTWSATKQEGLEPNPHFSFGQTGMHMKIGIDPTGGTDPWSKDIIWSAEKDVYDKFERYEVQAVARSNKVTVFTHSRPENPMKHNDVYLDDAELVAVGGGGPSAPALVNPPPAMVAVEGRPASANSGRISHIVKSGDTLFAIALQYGVPVDQIMALNGLKPDSRIEIGRELIIALPAPRPQAAVEPATGNPFISTGNAGSGRGTVCVRTFADHDANGLPVAGEFPLAINGLHVNVLNAQNEVVADQTLDAASEVCFTDLPAMTYRILADLPAGYLATQQHRWSISLPGDAIVAVPFGVQLDTAAQNRFPIEWAAILAALLVIGGVLIGLVIWLRRRRRYAWM
jgi:LysM repeat protein